MMRALGLTLAVALLTWGTAPLRAQEPPGLPPGVTAADTAAGNELFHGVGSCDDCHGAAGVGTADGLTLVEGQWKLGDGSFDWLVHMTRHGGLGVRDRGGDPQAMRGPTALDSVQVRQVAGYVWAISRARREPRPTSDTASP
jgi:mono/diheme cytochrome c family protein